MSIINFIPHKNRELNKFFLDNKTKSLNFLRKRYSSLSEDDLLDIYQESSLALFLNIHDGKLNNLTSSLYSYFLSICNNKALNTLRNTKRTLELDINKSITNEIDDDIFVESKISEIESLVYSNNSKLIEEDEERIRQCVKNMPKPCNQILWSQYWDKFSLKTIAELYRMKNEAVVKVQAMRCRNKFSEYLKNHNIKAWIG